MTNTTHTYPGQNDLSQRIANYEDVEIQTFQHSNYHTHDIENDIDPETNFFHSLNNDCRYYNEEQFNNTIKTSHKLSIIHFNSRSLYANFHNIKYYLGQFSQPFNIIAITETWINNERGMDFELEGYEMICKNRENKNGGGVALFVDKNLTYKVVKNMSTVINDVFECVTIEILMEKKKNIIVSCMYRTPGSNIDSFINWVAEKCTKTNHKTMFICGDYNIDLLNPNKHRMTDEFINTLYSLSLYPKITRPSRITSHCATLIDNIFTNVLDNNIISGLLINDITDHLPVFIVYNCNYNKTSKDIRPQYRRVRTEESMIALENNLIAYDWDSIYKENDVNIAYDKFGKSFKQLYDKNCPVREDSRKNKHKNDPWISKGLQNACKKKNTLYREFVKHRTKEAENKYKKYKNKLTSIIRICKKEYYSTILENNKNNIKSIWTILNNVIRDTPRHITYPQYFSENDKKINKMEEVVNQFNNYFVNIGPNLAEKIPMTDTLAHDDTPIKRNTSSMYLNPVLEK